MLRLMTKTAGIGVAYVGLLMLTACGGGTTAAIPETNSTGSFSITEATNSGSGALTATFPPQTGAVKYRVYLGQDSNVSPTISEQSRLFDATGAPTSRSALIAPNAATISGTDTTTDGGDTTTPTETPVSVSIDGVAPGVVYYMVVQALDANGDQLASSNVGAAMQDVAISTASYDETAGGYKVEWTKIGGVLDGYYVEWTTTSGDFSAGNKTELTSSGGITVPGLDKDTEYFFRVVAVAKNNAGTKAGTERSSAGGSCGSAHSWTGKAPIFSFASCDAEPGKTVWNNTPNEAGETLGSRSPAYGKLSFTITGTVNYEIGSGDAMLIFMNATNNNREVNWHFQYYNLGAEVEHRLTTQRFDGTCNPFCEQKSISRSVQFPNSSTDRSQAYHFDCMWESGNDAFTYASCDVTDPNNPSFSYKTGQVDTQGNYAALSYIGVGNGGYHNAGPYGWPAGGTISDFQLTFFQ